MAEGIIICYSTCWGCKFGHHSLEPHVWWGSDDVWEEHPEHTPPLPEGACGCNCEEEIELEKEWERKAALAWLEEEHDED